MCNLKTSCVGNNTGPNKIIYINITPLFRNVQILKIQGNKWLLVNTIKTKLSIAVIEWSLAIFGRLLEIFVDLPQLMKILRIYRVTFQKSLGFLRTCFKCLWSPTEKSLEAFW